jgi:hypothetical protein
MRVNPAHITRKKKGEIAVALAALLTEREKTTPNEPGLYAFTPLLTDVGARLGVAADGNLTAKAAREARLVKLELADDDVDRWYRHNHDYIENEALRRSGDIGKLARALLAVAFPEGLKRVDDAIEDENDYLHDAVSVLRKPEHAPTLAAMEFPAFFLDNLDKALTASDTALDEVIKARGDKKGQIESGQDAEGEWIDVVVRYRKYVGSRAGKRDKALYAEGQKLLAPLLDELARMKQERLAKETREKHAAEAKAKEEAAKKAGGEPPKTPA